jgi:transposase
VGRKSIEIKITHDSKTELIREEKHNIKASVRHRCKIVLLYLDGLSVKDISSIMNTNIISIYDWLHRYNAAGFKGLLTQKGQGRKPILEEQHLSIVRLAVEQERQRLQKAPQLIEAGVGKPLSQSTLTRFLKIITALTNE